MDQARWLRSIVYAVAVWSASRGTFLLIGAYSFKFDGQAVPWLRMWMQWDAAFYLSIADAGYQPPTVVTGLESGESNINFFPLFPMLITMVRTIIPSVLLAGIIAANLCLLVAAVLLHRLAQRRFDDQAADWAVISLMVVPGSFALSSPLSEAAFLLLSIAAVYLAPLRQGAAAASSALLTITRWTGILQGLGLALDWFIDRLRGREASYARLLPICLVPLPLALFLLYMFFLTGDGFASLHSNYAFWHQRFGVPFQSLVLFLSTKQPRLEMQSALALVLVLVLLSQARRFTPGEMFFVVASLASFTSSDAATPSLVRYTIGLYPVHLAIGVLCSRHSAMRVLLLCLALIGSAIAVFWFHGRDVYV